MRVGLLTRLWRRVGRWCVEHAQPSPGTVLRWAGHAAEAYCMAQVAADKRLLQETVTISPYTPRELWPEALDPIKKLEALDDDPNKVYVWILGPEAGDDELQDWAGEIQSAYINRFGHVPRAVHLTVRDVQDVKRLTSEDQRQLLKPWVLNDQQEAQGA